jgi:hypothetical protein
MWVPAGLAYTAAALVFAGMWIGSSSRSTLSGDRGAILAR